MLRRQDNNYCLGMDLAAVDIPLRARFAEPPAVESMSATAEVEPVAAVVCCLNDEKFLIETKSFHS